jgi:hypothetical protein
MKLNRYIYFQVRSFLQLLIICLCFINFVSLSASLRNPIAPPIKSSPSRPHQPFVIFSPPKCGTHLVGKTLSLMVNENPAYYLSGIGENSVLDSLNIVASEEARGCFVVGHHFTNTLLKTLVNKGYKIIFVVRDPRDQLISAVNWLKEGQWFWLSIAGMSNPHDQITEAITGAQHGWQSVESCFLSFENTLLGLPPESIYKVHFEKLVGVNGKGTSEEQINEILSIANCIGLKIDSKKIKYVTDNLFGGTATFRDGSIGKWKLVFTKDQKEQFKVRYNYLLMRLGYEKDSQW